jgi:hypothetical protein
MYDDYLVEDELVGVTLIAKNVKTQAPLFVTAFFSINFHYS